MPKITQLVLRLESKPGVLAKVARTLADAGVNIDALSAPETVGRGKIRMVVSDPARAKDVLRGAKYRPTEEAALSVTLENRPGALAVLLSSTTTRLTLHDLGWNSGHRAEQRDLEAERRGDT